ncbi:hypothetical protein [Legionella saoudiensis]|uniref:hypothetical protein n=1 Tax=Legionella saoudiensis TaxID=1750561 RepID=UPI00073139F8|nr:hypothetical protein [Legionella saoudiensis]
MKKKVSPVWTGSVISFGIVSFVAACAAPVLIVPIGIKIGISIAGTLGVAFSAGDTAVNHFSSCAAGENEKTTTQEGVDNDGNSVDIQVLSRHVQCLNQKVDEIALRQDTIEHRQNTVEMQREMDTKEQNARISMVCDDVDLNSSRISMLERSITSHVNKASTTFSSTASSSDQTSQEQTDTIPENVSTLLSKHGLHSSNQSEFRQPSDASSVRKRKNPSNLRF